MKASICCHFFECASIGAGKTMAIWPTENILSYLMVYYHISPVVHDGRGPEFSILFECMWLSFGMDLLLITAAARMKQKAIGNLNKNVVHGFAHFSPSLNRRFSWLPINFSIFVETKNKLIHEFLMRHVLLLFIASHDISINNSFSIGMKIKQKAVITAHWAFFLHHEKYLREINSTASDRKCVTEDKCYIPKQLPSIIVGRTNESNSAICIAIDLCAAISRRYK